MSEQLTQNITIDQFHGPFYVLVELLDKQKLNITEVNLSTVTKQYISAVNSQEYTDPYSLADFLVVSSRLLYLKSKTLLPMLVWDDEEEETVGLELQLKMYKKYYDASLELEKIIQKKQFTFAREQLAVDIESVFNPPHTLTTHALREAMRRIVQDIGIITKLPQKIINKTISMREKIGHIRDVIIQKLTTNFSDLLKDAKDKTEKIVIFLAVLELVKQQSILAEQGELHGEIIIKKS